MKITQPLIGMKKWRKRPVVITAIQIVEPCEVDTLEGTMRGNIGDYLIRGVKGELYFCKPDIFLATYEQPADKPAANDRAFIEHIQQHLEPEQEVVCKICGKTAREIIENGLS